MTTIKLDDGTYEFDLDDQTGLMTAARRHGEPWDAGFEQRFSNSFMAALWRVQDLEALEQRTHELERSNTALEQLRPVWAQYDVEPQTLAAALSGVWKLLGAESQTQCMLKLRAALDPWTAKADALPTEPGWYLVMLAPDNDWELMSATPLQVEFDAFKNMPQAFTYSDGWHDGPQNITAAVTDWMPLPAAPARKEG